MERIALYTTFAQFKDDAGTAVQRSGVRKFPGTQRSECS